MKAGRGPQDPVEDLTRLELSLVQLRPFERLTAEIGDDRRDRLVVRVHGAGLVEEEAHRADDLAGDAQRHGDARMGVRREAHPVRELVLERRPVVDDDRSCRLAPPARSARARRVRVGRRAGASGRTG